jgi:O-antigen/teichoic acid export membrane protein
MPTSKFLKNSGIYIVVSILQKAIGFFLLPLYTAFLTPDDYGILNVVLSISSLLSVFFILSLNGAASRFHYIYLDDELHIKKIWGTLCLFVIINSLFFGAFFIILHRLLLDPFTKGIAFFPFLFLGIISTILSPLYLFFQTYLQTKQDGIKYGINMTLNCLLNICLTILFVVVFRMSVLGVLLASCITSIIFFIYVLILFIPRITLSFDKIILKSSLNYSLPLVPHSLSSWLMAMVDRIFVNNIKGKAETGLYSVGYQFGNIINVLTSAVNQAYVPWFFEREKKGEIQQIIKVAEILTLIYCFIALGISLFAIDILKIMVSTNFQSAWRFTPFISFAYVFSGLYYFYVNILFLKQTKWIPVITFGSAIVGIIFNILLIPLVGSIGASISCLFSLFFSSILALFLSIRAEKIRFKYFRMYFYVFIFFIASLIIFFPVCIKSSYLFILKVILFFILLLIFGFIYKNDINYFTTIIIKQRIYNEHNR